MLIFICSAPYSHIVYLQFIFFLYVERSVSDDSLKRYVSYASESCIQELLSASDSNRAEGFDGWKVLSIDDGVEISKRQTGSLHVFRSRWLLRSVSPQQFISVANAIDAAKVSQIYAVSTWNSLSMQLVFKFYYVGIIIKCMLVLGLVASSLFDAEFH